MERSYVGEYGSKQKKYKAECPDEKNMTGSLDGLRILLLLRIALLIQ